MYKSRNRVEVKQAYKIEEGNNFCSQAEGPRACYGFIGGI